MRLSILSSLLLAAPLAAQTPTEPVDDDEPIIVTGIRIQDYRDRLRECLARACPTNEDADATLALAEALFMTGELSDARTAVRRSLNRNEGQARNFPEPMSDLHRAHARLSRHMGEDRVAIQATHNILDALQAGIEREDHRHFTARMELAEAQMMMGRLNAAKRELDRLAREARAVGREDVVILALLRELWFEHVAAPQGTARSRIIAMSRLEDPRRRMEQVGASLILARIYASEGETERASALIAGLGRGNRTRPRLIHSPPYTLQYQEVRFDGDIEVADAVDYSSSLNRLPPDVEDKWVDVGFWVLPDGSTSDVQVLRRGGNSGWADPLLASIRGRRYENGPDPAWRLERYTMTSEMQSVTGTRIRQRSARTRVEYLDLTDGETPPDAPS